MKPLPGIVGKLCEKMGRLAVAESLGLTVKGLEAIAHNKAEPGVETAKKIGAMCDEHEIARILYIPRGRKVKDIFIASTASGWVSWTLKRGWHLRSRYIGGTTNDLLEPVDKETLVLARGQWWPG
jgi:DNA-binding XRE family transcriptional regulator